MQCPVCKAENLQEQTCRRCKADLSLLWELETSRANAMTMARQYLIHGDWRQAADTAAEAYWLRKGIDAKQADALACLISHDFAGAWRIYKHMNQRGTEDTE